MRTTAAFAALVLASAATIGIASAIPALYPANDSSSAFALQFVRTGGFAGVNDVLTIDDQGRAVYSSRFGPSFNITLAQSELSSLRGTLSSNLGTVQNVIHPRSGAADFFSYSLTVTLGGKTSHLSWVDGWASLEPFPIELQAIQQALQGTIQLHS